MSTKHATDAVEMTSITPNDTTLLTTLPTTSPTTSTAAPPRAHHTIPHILHVVYGCDTDVAKLRSTNPGFVINVVSGPQCDQLLARAGLVDVSQAHANDRQLMAALVALYEYGGVALTNVNHMHRPVEPLLEASAPALIVAFADASTTDDAPLTMAHGALDTRMLASVARIPAFRTLFEGLRAQCAARGAESVLREFLLASAPTSPTESIKLLENGALRHLIGVAANAPVHIEEGALDAVRGRTPTGGHGVCAPTLTPWTAAFAARANEGYDNRPHATTSLLLIDTAEPFDADRPIPQAIEAASLFHEHYRGLLEYGGFVVFNGTSAEHGADMMARSFLEFLGAKCVHRSSCACWLVPQRRDLFKG